MDIQMDTLERYEVKGGLLGRRRKVNGILEPNILSSGRKIENCSELD